MHERGQCALPGAFVERIGLHIVDRPSRNADRWYLPELDAILIRLPRAGLAATKGIVVRAMTVAVARDEAIGVRNATAVVTRTRTLIADDDAPIVAAQRSVLKSSEWRLAEDIPDGESGESWPRDTNDDERNDGDRKYTCMTVCEARHHCIFSEPKRAVEERTWATVYNRQCFCCDKRVRQDESCSDELAQFGRRACTERGAKLEHRSARAAAPPEQQLLRAKPAHVQRSVQKCQRDASPKNGVLETPACVVQGARRVHEGQLEDEGADRERHGAEQRRCISRHRAAHSGDLLYRRNERDDERRRLHRGKLCQFFDGTALHHGSQQR